MPINRDRLETRLAELKLQAEQLKQQFVATTGAIADIEFWINEEADSAASEAPKA